MSKPSLLLTQVPADNFTMRNNEKCLSLIAIYCYFLKPFTTAQCGGKYILEGWSQGVTSYMTMTVGLRGNTTTAMLLCYLML